MVLDSDIRIIRIGKLLPKALSHMAFFSVCLTALGLVGCRQPGTPATTRHLSRPVDFALFCGPSESRSYDKSEAETAEHLYGAVLNHGSDTITLFRAASTCDAAESDNLTNADRMVDLGKSNAGFGGIAVGRAPHALAISAGGCIAMTLNEQACDATRIDLGGIVASLSAATDLPSGLSQEVLLSASNLPASQSLLAQDMRDIVFNPGDDENCSLPKNAYVSFPECGYVGHIDANTGEILDGIQLGATNADDSVGMPAVCMSACGDPASQGVATQIARPGRISTNASGTLLVAGLESRAEIVIFDLAASGKMIASRRIALDVGTNGGAGGATNASAIGIKSVSVVESTDLGSFVYAVTTSDEIHVVDLTSETECELNPDLSALSDLVPLVQARCLPIGTTARRSGVQSAGYAFYDGDNGRLAIETVSFFKSSTSSSTTSTFGGLPLRGEFGIILFRNREPRLIAINDTDRVSDVISAGGNAQDFQKARLPHRPHNLWRADTEIGRVRQAMLTQISDLGSAPAPVLVSEVDGAPVGFGGSGISLLTPMDEPTQRLNRTLAYEPEFDIGSGQLSLGDDGSLRFGNSAADYCAAGLRESVVEDQRTISPGDILSIRGCKTTADCSAEAICEKTSSSSVSGLCLYKDPDNPEQPKQDITTCRKFLTNALEFEVSAMSSTSLSLAPLPVLPSPIEQRDAAISGGTCLANSDCDDGYYCALLSRVYPFADQTIEKGSCVRHVCDNSIDELRCPNDALCVQTHVGLPPQCVRSALGAVTPQDQEIGVFPVIYDDTLAAPCASDDDCAGSDRCVLSGVNAGRCGHIDPCLQAAQTARGFSGRSLAMPSPAPRQYDDLLDTCIDVPNLESTSLRMPLHLLTLPVISGPTCQRNLIDDGDVFPNPCYDLRSITSAVSGYREKNAADASPDFLDDEGTQLLLNIRDKDIGMIWSMNDASQFFLERAIQTTIDDNVYSSLFGVSRGLRYSIESNAGFSYVEMLPYGPIVSSTRFSWPTVATQGADGNIYVLDSGDSGRGPGNQVRRIDPKLATFSVQSTDLFFVR